MTQDFLIENGFAISKVNENQVLLDLDPFNSPSSAYLMVENAGTEQEEVYKYDIRCPHNERKKSLRRYETHGLMNTEHLTSLINTLTILKDNTKCTFNKYQLSTIEEVKALDLRLTDTFIREHLKLELIFDKRFKGFGKGWERSYEMELLGAVIQVTLRKEFISIIINGEDTLISEIYSYKFLRNHFDRRSFLNTEIKKLLLKYSEEVLNKSLLINNN